MFGSVNTVYSLAAGCINPYLSAPPQVAQQVSVLQLLHDRNQRCSERDHAKELWQEGMRPQLGQEGRKAQEAVSFCGVCRVCEGRAGERGE